MKRIFLFFFSLLIAFQISISCSANTTKNFCSDSLALLTEEQKEAIQKEAEKLYHGYGLAFYFVSAEIHPSMNADSFSRKTYYDEISRADISSSVSGGAIFLIDSQSRQWSVVFFDGISQAFPEKTLDSLESQIIPLLRSGDYYNAALSFYRFSTSVLENNAFATDYESDSFPIRMIVSSIVISAVIAFIVVYCFYHQLKNARRHTAANYLKPGSFRLTHSADLFLYRTVSRRVREKNQSSSSSGRSSGRSGRF